ncbi:MAG: hypothetical protein WC865_13645 [Bacteroidales bacterium]
MDYIDRVYVDLKDREPGKFPMSSLKDPEKFISAVKFLIDGEWLTNVYFSQNYDSLIISRQFSFVTDKKPIRINWYDRNDNQCNN